MNASPRTDLVDLAVFVVAHQDEVVGVVTRVFAQVAFEPARRLVRSLAADDVGSLTESELAIRKLAFQKVTAAHLASAA